MPVSTPCSAPHRCCLLQCQAADHTPYWLQFGAPVATRVAHRTEDVLPLLHAVEHAVRDGQAAAGYLTYEAAAGLDRAIPSTPPAPGQPLAEFSFYAMPQVQRSAHPPPHPFPVPGAAIAVPPHWQPSCTPEEYVASIQRIKEWIASGDTYQVNYTLRLRARLAMPPFDWFCHLWYAQRPRYAAYLETEKGDVFCSSSPELFFLLEGDSIRCRPMKGTARRGCTLAEDTRVAEQLQSSEKDRAENVMIVDMIRNDLGRIAPFGTVKTGPLFERERYPTVWQMTSTVRARTQASLPELLTALFPCASITGAPKVRTMQLIHALEPEPRGIYTGAIGCYLPRHPLTGESQRFAHFNVAIRTAHVHTATHTAEYGVGGGIVWDSTAKAEYRECLDKALILTRKANTFDLLETLRWQPVRGYFLLEAHLARLHDTARYMDYPCAVKQVRQVLQRATATWGAQPQRVRVLLDVNGTPRVEATPFTVARATWRIALDDRPVDRTEPLLYHKTTHRERYQQAHARHPDADDVLLWNREGYCTETCNANLLYQQDGVWYTPPVQHGLLAGTFRNALLQRGRICERPLPLAELSRIPRYMLINSVRGFIKAQFQIQ